MRGQVLKPLERGTVVRAPQNDPLPGRIRYRAADHSEVEVLKPLERGTVVRAPQNDPLPGRIRYRAADHSEVEVPFGDKDQCGEFTLRHGDWVQFQVATDRRDQLKRATNISLLDESFNVSGESLILLLRVGHQVPFGDKDQCGAVPSGHRPPGSAEARHQHIPARRVLQRLRRKVSLILLLRVGHQVPFGDKDQCGAVPSGHRPPGSAEARHQHIPARRVLQRLRRKVSLILLLLRVEHQVPFGDKDQCCQFQVATDRRDQLKRATNISLLDESFNVSGERYHSATKTSAVQFQVATDRRDQLKRATNISLLDESFNVSGERSVATDRRDQLKRATNISLLDESFNVSGERREQGVVCSLREGFGFIRCVEREQTLFFHFAEVLRLGQELSVGDEVEFTVDPVSTFSNMNTRVSAIRIKHLPAGTVHFETLIERGVRGVVTKEAQLYSNTNSPTAHDPNSSIMHLPAGTVHLETLIERGVRGVVTKEAQLYSNTNSPTAHDPNSSIKHLPAGTVHFETLIERGVRGVVTKEAQLYSNTNSPTAHDPNSSIKHLPCTVHFETLIERGVRGVVTKEAQLYSNTNSPTAHDPNSSIKHLPCGTVHLETLIERGVRGVVTKEAQLYSNTNSPTAHDPNSSIKHLPAGTVHFETLIERGVRGVVTKEAQLYSNTNSPTAHDPNSSIKHLPAGTVHFETLIERGVRGVVTKEAQLYSNTNSPTAHDPNSSIKHLPCGTVHLETLIERGVRGVVTKEAQLYSNTNSPTAHDPNSSIKHLPCTVHFETLIERGVRGVVTKEAQLYSNTNSPTAHDPNSSIKHLPCGTVHLETLIERGVRGVVTKEAQLYSNTNSPTAHDPNRPEEDLGLRNELPPLVPVLRDRRPVVDLEIAQVSVHHVFPADQNGIISCQINGAKKTIQYNARKCESKMLPRIGDKVVFDIYQMKSTKELVALSVQTQHSLTNGASNGGGARPAMQGFIAALKDGFGFIETADHTKEVFFHFSNLEGVADTLELGTEVEYTLGRVNGSGGGCASAEFVRVLPRGAVPVAKPLEPTLNGTVTRTLRALNPDQAQYSGLIQVEGGTSYEFGIMGLACKREILQVGDPVTFQADIEGRATNIVPIRKKRRAVVDAIKGGFGFLSLEAEENRRLFFHMSEVRGHPSDLQPGDSVEFVMLTNPRNGKCSACNVVKIRGFRPRRPLADILAE
ncbi:hypothetical protein NE865_07241 [Phthorimaea operculella]|nr:hypothetical protein NE865_07241 [Phthorimaea operculella]